MSLDINKYENMLTVSYSPYNTTVDFIFYGIEENKTFCLKNVFYIYKEIIISEYDAKDYIEFKIADKIIEDNNEYYKIDRKVFGIDFDIFIHSSCKVHKNFFISTRDLSIFKIINDKIGLQEPIYIGGPNENSISEDIYLSIIQSLPTQYELTKYDYARVCSVIKNYFTPKKDIETQFSRYVSEKEMSLDHISEINFEDFDLQRYIYLLLTLEHMLENESDYSENNWQNEIIKFIKILFPKYVISVREARINKKIAGKDKYIDIMLGDFNGHVDIIEIKKPFGIDLLNKQLYRENYIPTKALTGAIMQAEKYIYYLTKGGLEVEKDINNQFSSNKPQDYSFKVINPKTLIIMGRTKDYSTRQLEDLEIIRRKYKNVIDIISYDDLIQRLRTTIEMLKKDTSQK